MFEFTWTYPVTLAACFSYILGALRHGVAEQAGTRAFSMSRAMLVYTRLGSMIDRIAFLFAREPFTPPPPRPRRAPANPPTRKPRPPNPLSGKFGWLRRLLQDTTYDVAVQTGQLHNLIADPENLPCLTADPAFGRALRPLCHMLGITLPEPLRTPPKPSFKPGPSPQPAPEAVAPEARDEAPDEAPDHPPERQCNHPLPTFVPNPPGPRDVIPPRGDPPCPA